MSVGENISKPFRAQTWHPALYSWQEVDKFANGYKNIIRKYIF